MIQYFYVYDRMTVNKIYLSETMSVITSFYQIQIYELNRMLLSDYKCFLFYNEANTEIIFICEGCRSFLEERHFERFTFDELKECLIEIFLKRSQLIVFPDISTFLTLWNQMKENIYRVKYI